MSKSPTILELFGAQDRHDVESGFERVFVPPVPGDAGAHGRFGRTAHTLSLQLWATERRGWLTLGGVAAAAGAVAWARALGGRAA